MHGTVEIRVPTFRRPQLLQRALASVISQSYPDWRCIVLDDSTDEVGAERVCQSFPDPRILYHRNHRHLGRLNIDNAFSLAAAPDATFCCVLEDDSLFSPDLLESNISILSTHEVDIVLRNQLLEMRDANGVMRIGPRTRYGGQYVDGIATQAELWGSFFYSTGANTASLFWRLQRGLDFATSYMSIDSDFQERLRTLCIERSVYIAMDPKIVWRDNGDESFRPKVSGWRWRLGQLQAADRERALYRQLYPWLQQRGLAHQVWQSRFGSVDAEAERVFRRVGIRVPTGSRMSARARIAICMKRYFAEIVSSVVPEPVNYVLQEDRIRPVTHSDRAPRN
jgi:glycosyltransferase involved in cell wall biosynthesis